MAKALKPGEVTIPPPEAPDAGLVFVGFCETPWERLQDCPKSPDPAGPACALVLHPAFAAAITGLTAGDLIEVLMWFHQSRRDLVVIAPDPARGPRGVFALRAPVRPNPVALSRVRIEAVEANRLIVRGLDALNGTPLIDIKPAR